MGNRKLSGNVDKESEARKLRRRKKSVKAWMGGREFWSRGGGSRRRDSGRRQNPDGAPECAKVGRKKEDSEE